MKKTPKSPKTLPKKAKAKQRKPLTLSATERDILRAAPIKVGAFKLRVQFTKGIAGSDWGSMDFPKQLIYLRRGMKHVVTVSTLLHECLHVIMATHVSYSALTQITKKWEGSELRDLLEEETVCGFETGLLALFADNPKLYALIGRHCK